MKRILTIALLLTLLVAGCKDKVEKQNEVNSAFSGAEVVATPTMPGIEFVVRTKQGQIFFVEFDGDKMRSTLLLNATEKELKP